MRKLWPNATQNYFLQQMLAYEAFKNRCGLTGLYISEYLSLFSGKHLLIFFKGDESTYFIFWHVNLRRKSMKKQLLRNSTFVAKNICIHTYANTQSHSHKVNGAKKLSNAKGNHLWVVGLWTIFIYRNFSRVFCIFQLFHNNQIFINFKNLFFWKELLFSPYTANHRVPQGAQLLSCRCTGVPWKPTGWWHQSQPVPQYSCSCLFLLVELLFQFLSVTVSRIFTRLWTFLRRWFSMTKTETIIYKLLPKSTKAHQYPSHLLPTSVGIWGVLPIRGEPWKPQSFDGHAIRRWA